MPDGEDQFTSDHGWNLAQDSERLRPADCRIRAAWACVGLFITPFEQMAAARAAGLTVCGAVQPNPTPLPGASPERAARLQRLPRRRAGRTASRPGIERWP